MIVLGHEKEVAQVQLVPNCINYISICKNKLTPQAPKCCFSSPTQTKLPFIYLNSRGHVKQKFSKISNKGRDTALFTFVTLVTGTQQSLDKYLLADKELQASNTENTPRAYRQIQKTLTNSRILK